MEKIAIIGGTGVYDPSILGDVKEVGVSTPYGMMNAVTGNYQGFDVVFMNVMAKAIRYLPT